MIKAYNKKPIPDIISDAEGAETEHGYMLAEVFISNTYVFHIQFPLLDSTIHVQ